MGRSVRRHAKRGDMKPQIGAGFGLLLMTVLALAPASGQAHPGVDAAAFRYTRIYADSAGASHFGDEEMPLALVDFAPPLPPVAATSPMAATNLVVITVPAGSVGDWHPVPRRQVNIVLSGEVEIEVSDGERRRFGAGSWVLGEDTWGLGHITRVVSSVATRFVVVSLGAQ
jgi:hypothetical protein